MALHGLRHITIGIPEVEPAASFYDDFGLIRDGSSFATTDGGEQLLLVERPFRQIVELTLAADDPDDLARIGRAADSHGVDVRSDGDAVVVHEPALRADFRVAVFGRLQQSPPDVEPSNAPGAIGRPNARPQTLFEEPPVRPRRLGHVAVGSPDLEATSGFLRDVLGFKLSDSVPGILEFLRCSSDHHNVALVGSPAPFLHHSSWQMDSLDHIGHGATQLLAVDPDRHLWGLGRHFLGSNLFWYFRDPAGNFAEYFADLDQIVDDAEWLARTWTPDKALYAWGPPPPPGFIDPSDLDEIAAALV